MSTPLLPSALMSPLFSSAAMREILSDTARLNRMLRAEAALAAAEASVGVIPRSAAKPIAEACHAKFYDASALGLAAVSAGNLAIPLVKALTAEVAKKDAEAARYVHWGATSQDIIDTALVLELRAVIDDLVTELDRAIPAFTTLAEKHRHTPTVGRTWLQQALPMPFGLKVAGYASALTRDRARLKRVRN
jgi:3-carboxy-cis,cis-muconate cycloisomerase